MTHDLRGDDMDKAVGRYSSLFTLPSHRFIVTILCIQCTITGIAVLLPLNVSSHGLFIGIFLGVLLFFVTLLSNYLTVHLFLRKDFILDLRRCLFLSLASNSILLVFMLIASLASSSDQSIWFKVASLGIFASLSLRCLVFYTISFVTKPKIFFSVILQPVLFLALLLGVALSSFELQIYPFFYFFPATFAAFLGVYVFISSLNTVGIEALGIPSIEMFKAFLANWTEDLEEPLEDILERLSEEREVKVSLIAFQNKHKKKAVIVVPRIHPGPFKNVGSSSIPSLIQKALEEKLECVVSVPHGISGHELDLASQAQNEVVLSRILQTSKFKAFHPYATPFQSNRKDDATVGCQIFGDFAFLTLTLSPETMEDLPFELNDIISQEVKKVGLAGAVVVDAHNCIQGPFNPHQFIAPIKEAVATVLKEAVSCELSRFEVGAAKLIPTDIGIKEGVGPGGISIIVVKVKDQKTVYVTIDGNNMVSGLREKILSSLKKMGVNGGEILTTDTHVVNAVVLADRGYYPVGEMLDQNRFVEYIKEAVTNALRDLEPSEASWSQENISGVKVIGERRINDLSLIVDEVAKKTKKTFTFVFPALGILLTVLLVFL